MISPLLTSKEVERMLGFSTGTLAVLRCTRSLHIPPHIKIGRSIRYDPIAVQDWLQAQYVPGRVNPPPR